MWAFFLCLDLSFRLVAGFPTQSACREGIVVETQEAMGPNVAAASECFKVVEGGD